VVFPSLYRPGRTVAFTDGRLEQAELMPHRYCRVPASWSSFAGFRFPPELILVAI